MTGGSLAAERTSRNLDHGKATGDAGNHGRPRSHHHLSGPMLKIPLSTEIRCPPLKRGTFWV